MKTLSKTQLAVVTVSVPSAGVVGAMIGTLIATVFGLR
jgi:hypothetical protein